HLAPSKRPPPRLVGAPPVLGHPVADACPAELVDGDVLVADLPSRLQPHATRGWPPPGAVRANRWMRSTQPSTTPSVAGRVAGSSQSASNAALRLDAPSPGVPACSASALVPSASPTPAGER